jgi:rfaE bifunctional protein nucleotidyltransferase chain/domain
MAEEPVTGKGKAEPLKIVLASGCFDLLHVGHVKHLEEARRMGDFLFVGLTKDEFVGKGVGRPIVPFKDRAECLRGLRSVTAVIGVENSVEAILQAKPQIFVKGCDYLPKGLLREEELACREVGAEIRFTNTEKRSTTGLIERVIHLEKERIRALTMWHRTSESEPPKHEVLAVIRKISNRGEQVEEDAIWDGEFWTERKSKEQMKKSSYYLWRRLEY